MEGNKKPILLVVSVDTSNTENLLHQSLYKGLANNINRLNNKTIWVPLMGTGAGGLGLEESFNITIDVLTKISNSFRANCKFFVAIPENDEGKEFYKKVKSSNLDKASNSSEVEETISRLNCNFFIAGSYWSGDEQSDRFFKDQLWENGHEDKFVKEVNTAKVGDILFLKSTFSSNNISYLRIKGVGKVLNNHNNGSKLDMDWRIKNVQIDIEGLGKYRSTFSIVNKDDVFKILQSLGIETIKDSGLFEPTKTPDKTSIPNISKIAGLVSDSEKGIDYLDITKDVVAFAKVIAAKSFEPPLAIALFGKWGSGKSFFMRKLKEQVMSFSDRNVNGIYCKGIAHIHFNAWSYMDANLWASIVSKIFESLNEYITENSKTNNAKKEIEKQLTTTLSITKEEISALVNKKTSVAEEINILEAKRDKISEQLEQKIVRIQTNTVYDIVKNIDEQFSAKEKIISSLKENNSYVQTEAELKKIVPEKYWNNPEVAYYQIKSKYTFLKEFFRADKIQSNLGWLAFILSIIFLVPILFQIFYAQIRGMNFIIPQAGLSFLILAASTWKRAETVYSQLQPVIASFWKIKEDHEKQIKEALSKFEQEEKALKLEIDKGKAEMLLINEQIEKAETIKTELEFRIDNALATEALYSFIDKRSKSEDYKKQLGIISIIRNDLEILNDLFTDHNQEVDKAKQAEKFKSYFEKPLERIILYIDDLDRCPEDNVVQVLEAVNLLMAFPLFIVIVGVDSRWVKNALIKKHALQFTGRMSGESQAEHTIELIEPSNYLEKIFQVPFHLKDAKDDSVKDMIRHLAQTQPVIKEIFPINTLPVVAVEEAVNNIPPQPKVEKDPIQQGTSEAKQPSSNLPLDKPEALILTEEEIALMQDMSEVIGNNPRAVKRFVNIYRIIKAHEEFDYAKESTDEELLLILFLLALPLGKYRKLLPSFETFIQDDSNALKQFTLYLQPIFKINEGELDAVKHHLDVTLSNKASFRMLQNTVVTSFKKHNEFIKRFTFKNL